MSEHPSRYSGPSITDHVRELIEAAIPGARAEVEGGGGHFRIVVTAAAFAGKTLVERHRMVYGAIAELTRGDDAPVHAVDSLVIRLP